MNCPYCGSKRTEEHGEPLEYIWWLCRDCGKQWDVDEEKADRQSQAWMERSRKDV